VLIQGPLPVFNLASREAAAWLVSLRHPQDWENEWSQTWGLSNLTEFVGKALDGRIVALPAARARTASAMVRIPGC
jgi:hypothetical protein